MYSPSSMSPVALFWNEFSSASLTSFSYRNSLMYSSQPPGEGYIPGYRSPYTSLVISTRSDAFIVSPTSSFSSFAATPPKASPSNTPAGISVKQELAIGTRGWRVRIVYFLPLHLRTIRIATEGPRINTIPGTCLPSGFEALYTRDLNFINPILPFPK